jgi:putative DNA primase/helicase
VDAIIGRVRADETKPERTEQDKQNALIRLLEGAGRVLPETPSWIYLNRRCGTPAGLTGDLRHHPGIKHTSGGTYPALLAILRYPDGAGACVHRTYLTEDGQKAAVDPVRMMMPAPSPIAGSAIRLGPISDRIGVAEGLETAICAGKLFEIPVWSAVSANGVSSWVPPDGVRSVVICGDNDASFTGQEAVYSLAKRLKCKGFDIEIKIPEIVGQDWCDIWGMRYNINSQSDT